VRLSRRAAFRYGALPLLAALLYQVFLSIIKTNAIHDISAAVTVLYTGFLVFFSPYAVALLLLYKSRNPLLSWAFTAPSALIYGWAYRLDVAPETPQLYGSGNAQVYTIAWLFALALSAIFFPLWRSVCRRWMVIDDNEQRARS
jgi:hypothetical protein